MDLNTLLVCLLIVLARITDVSLGTIRTMFVFNGRRDVAFILGFFEVLVWVLVVSKVITNLNNPLYAVAYAFGYAAGNYVGMTIESWVAFGEQVVRIFTREGARVAAALREDNWRVTEFNGTGRDGPLSILLIQSPRRKSVSVIAQARALDPQCYYIVDDVRQVARSAAAALTQRK